jgi:hypothetical protein
MAATIPSTSLVPVQPAFTDAERLALAGYLAGYRGLTGRHTPSTCVSSRAGAEPGHCRCSKYAGPTSRCSPVNSKPRAAPAPP